MSNHNLSSKEEYVMKYLLRKIKQRKSKHNIALLRRELLDLKKIKINIIIAIEILKYILKISIKIFLFIDFFISS